VKSLRFLPLVLILLSCGSSYDADFEESELSIPEKLEQACTEQYLSTFIPDKNDREFLIDFYSSTRFKPLWINDSSSNIAGISLKGLIERPLRIGLPEGLRLMERSENLIQQEIAGTLAFSRSIRAMKDGFFELEESKFRKLSPLSSDSILNYVRTFSTLHEDSAHLLYQKFMPADTVYQKLFKGLLADMRRLPYDRTKFDVKTMKQDSISSVRETRKALISKGYLNEDHVSDDLYFDSVLRVFQSENGLKPDGVIGKYTARALNESTIEKWHRVILSMEKIRSRDQFPSKFILINLPEYKLRFFEQDTLRSEHKIIIGAPETPTPELTSKLSKIIVYPYWSVPYSISSKEILPAVKRNVNYLKRNNYRVYRKDVEIDPYHVNWRRIKENAFPYKIIQDPGPTNSLGVLKFDFPNQYSVYFHDTPSKGLFGADIRAFSHGCMRTHKPIDLAKKILDYDSIPRKRNDFTRDTLDSLLAREKNVEIRLLDRIPIFIIYQTVCVEGQRLVIYPDIYDRDQKYLKVLMKS
jgi:murein L,D-transpeptidase YcbB/YkuD